ncbi:MAG TPA: hypothetical protein VE753_07320 [Gaiellaceae bacterium]|nr:hypothetical protein [Gaiellaceae bacterium]
MSSLRPPLEEPLSPELVLVCPELAERARLLLPEPAWVAARFEVRVLAGPVRPAPLQTLVLALACVLMTVTPLVLTLFALSGHTSRVPRTAQVSRPAQVWP